jgi:hypothetical protein
MKPKRHAKLLAAVAGAFAVFAIAGPAAQAEAPDNPGYEQFAGCPNPFTENSKIVSCIRTDITGGHFQMGSKDVPIKNPMVLTGGIEDELKGFQYNSEGGLSQVKQEVPGGIIGLTGLDWLINFLNAEQLKLYAVTELAGTPVLGGLTSAQLPIKAHLINPVLGSKCYVGSNSNPIVLNLITGTTSPPSPNKPITGKTPKFSTDPVLEIFHEKEGIFVDNSFAAPGASGCVLNLGIIPVNIDSIINLASGLPAAAGTNETTQNFDLELVNAFFPYE